MILAEKSTLLVFLKSTFRRKQLLYCTKSFAVRIAELIFSHLRIPFKTQKLDFGNVDHAPEIRKNAYETAENYLIKIQHRKWTGELSQLFSINFDLIVNKFIFDELYMKYEFYELAMRHAIENPNKRQNIYIQPLFSEPYVDKLSNHFKISALKEFGRVNFFLTLFLLPFLLMYYWRKHGTTETLHFNNEIVCCIDEESTYEMFNNLLGEYSKTRYVIEKHNVKRFSDERLRELNISVLGLTKVSYRYLKKIVYKYIMVCLKYYRDISLYGVRLFWLFYIIVRGKANAVQGKGNYFFTFEHLVTEKAARNEYLKLDGSMSIFIPKNAYVSTPHLHSEIFINYDVICSAGNHVEEHYEKKGALTKIYLPVGAYDNHRKTVAISAYDARVARLKSFKGDSLAVTIISPGICDPTYSHEIKLMILAQKIAQQRGVKVFIRLKPVPLIPKYADFYTAYVGGQDSIMLTAAEYELFDFLEVTDLFVTSISTAACDVAMCGAQVMFIDFMKTPDLFLFWSVVEDLVKSEENAFEMIMQWVNDKKDGRVRTRHKETMKQLTEYIGYRFPCFDSYKANLISQLQKHVFCANLMLKI